MMNGVPDSDLEQHLLFHKSIIDDNVENEKIDRYLRILNDVPDCERMQDPVDESIRTVFRLVLEENFDPWAIDLRQFVRTYSEKVDGMSKVDIIVAGKLILMAWKVLRMQADATRSESEWMPEEIFDEEPMDDIDTDKLHVPGIALREAYSRNPTRPVTMMELLDAFDEARDEIEASLERERIREERKKNEPKGPKLFDNKAHKEVSKSDVEEVWQRIEKIGTGAFSIFDLFTNDVDNNITVFLSTLQLVRNGKLSMWQEELPYGNIMLEIKTDWVSGKLESAEEDIKVPEAVI